MVKKLFRILFLYFAIFIVIGCEMSRQVNINKFSYRDKLAYNNQIKINGFYVDSLYKIDCNLYYTFYLNGMVCFFADSDYNINNARDLPWFWGYYIFSGDTIKIQRLNPRVSGFSKFKVYEVWAKIINDTTIHFSEYIEINGEKKDVDWTLRFKYWSEKPDSTNILMKCIEREEMKKQKKNIKNEHKK